MICCLNPHCSQENPSCPDSTKYCSSCRTQLVTLSGRYRPIKRLGQGGFGITYLAEDEKTFNKPCVIKQLTLQIPDAKRLFEGEAKRLDELADCPEIPSLLAYHSDVDYLFLVQEFVAGQNLDYELQQKGAFSEGQVKEFLQEILPVLTLIHQKDIIHRDIKLENIMRREDGRLVLIDFGIAKLIPANNTLQPGTRAGTDGYAPPEQIKEGIVKPASDLYSLGASCFHLLTNINPGTLFMDYGYQWTSRWQEHLKQPVSKEFGNIIDKSLKYEYADRYQSAAAVLRDLDSSDPRTIVANTPRKNSTINLGAKNNNWKYAALLGVSVAISGGLYVALNLLRPAAEHQSSEGSKPSENNEKIQSNDSTTANNLSTESPESYYNRGNSLSDSGDHQGSIADYTKAINLQPNYPQSYYRRGNAHLKLAAKKEAITDYTEAIRLKPDYAEAYGNRGIVRVGSGDQPGAIADFTQAIKLQPNLPKNHYLRGLVRSKTGNQSGAIADFTQALNLKTDFSDAYKERGDARFKIGDKQGALEDFNQVLKLQPDSHEAYNNRGAVRLALGDKQGALEDLNQAIKLHTDSPEAYKNRGSARMALGDKQGAIKDFNQAIKLRPDYPDAYKNRGLAQLILGDKRGAIKDLKQAAALYQKTQGKDKNADEVYQNVMELLRKLGQ
jgi:serine/threonine protein kinase